MHTLLIKLIGFLIAANEDQFRVEYFEIPPLQEFNQVIEGNRERKNTL